MDKYSLEKDYRQLLREYRVAHNEDERWGIRKGMARVERIAAEEFGFEFADELYQMMDN